MLLCFIQLIAWNINWAITKTNGQRLILNINLIPATIAGLYMKALAALGAPTMYGG